MYVACFRAGISPAGLRGIRWNSADTELNRAVHGFEFSLRDAAVPYRVTLLRVSDPTWTGPQGGTVGGGSLRSQGTPPCALQRVSAFATEETLAEYCVQSMVAREYPTPLEFLAGQAETFAIRTEPLDGQTQNDIGINVYYSTY